MKNLSSKIITSIIIKTDNDTNGWCQVDSQVLFFVNTRIENQVAARVVIVRRTLQLTFL